MSTLQLFLSRLAVILLALFVFYIMRGIPIGTIPTEATANYAVITDVKTYLTSTEAAQLAYEKAMQWNQGAVLWSISIPSTMLLSGWEDSDQAGQWKFEFADPRTRQLYSLQIKGTQIISDAPDETKIMVTDFREPYPKMVPQVSMAQAAQEAKMYGAPDDEKPVVTYSIDNAGSSYHGTPTWQFTYLDNGVTFVIDALGGTYLEAVENTQI